MVKLICQERELSQDTFSVNQANSVNSGQVSHACQIESIVRVVQLD